MTNVSRKYEHGVETYRNNLGQLHSADNDTPARSSSTKFGQPLKEFYFGGELHRENDLPAFIGFIEQGGKASFVAGWFINGRAHREGDNPTAVEHNVADDVVTITYSKNGILDRDPKLGPAVFRYKIVNGQPYVESCAYFEKGKQLGGALRSTVLVPGGISFDSEFGKKIFAGLVGPNSEAVTKPLEVVVDQTVSALENIDLTVDRKAPEKTVQPVQVPKPKNKGGRPKGAKTKVVTKP